MVYSNYENNKIILEYNGNYSYLNTIAHVCILLVLEYMFKYTVLQDIL